MTLTATLHSGGTTFLHGLDARQFSLFLEIEQNQHRCHVAIFEALEWQVLHLVHGRLNTNHQLATYEWKWNSIASWSKWCRKHHSGTYTLAVRQTNIGPPWCCEQALQCRKSCDISFSLHCVWRSIFRNASLPNISPLTNRHSFWTAVPQWWFRRRKFWPLYPDGSCHLDDETKLGLLAASSRINNLNLVDLRKFR